MFNTVRPDIVRYEMRMVQGVDPHVQHQKKPGFFGRLLSGFGKVLGAIAAPLSFIFPPAAIAAAGMYGIGTIGDQMQGRAYAKAAEKQARDRTTNVVFPGLDIGMGSPLQPVSGPAAGEMEIGRVLESRGNTVSQMSQRI